MTIPSAVFADLYTAVNSLPWLKPSTFCEVAVFSYDSQLKQFIRDPILITDDSPTFSGIDGIELVEHPAENQREFTQADLDNHAADELSRCYVGYDVEYTPLPPEKDKCPDAELVSHQFYVAYNGARKAFILLTNERLHESEFVDLVAHIVPPDLKKVYVVAHFRIAT